MHLWICTSHFVFTHLELYYNYDFFPEIDRKLFLDYKVMGSSTLFGFLCASGISLVTLSKKGQLKKAKECKKVRTQYIMHILKETAAKGKVFIAPHYSSVLPIKMALIVDIM